MATIARRQFLSHTAAAAGVAALEARAVAPAASHPIGAAIIGTAHPHAVGHLRTLRESSQLRSAGRGGAGSRAARPGPGRVPAGKAFPGPESRRSCGTTGCGWCASRPIRWRPCATPTG